jgi:hypothetical protein
MRAPRGQERLDNHKMLPRTTIFKCPGALGPLAILARRSYYWMPKQGKISPIDKSDIDCFQILHHIFQNRLKTLLESPYESFKKIA